MTELKSALEAACLAARPAYDPGLFRMAIDRSFTVAGHGTVVTGTVASGEVAIGDELQWQPDGRTVRVRGLHRHDQPVEQIGEVLAPPSIWSASTIPRSTAVKSWLPPVIWRRPGF